MSRAADAQAGPGFGVTLDLPERLVVVIPTIGRADTLPALRGLGRDAFVDEVHLTPRARQVPRQPVVRAIHASLRREIPGRQGPARHASVVTP